MEETLKRLVVLGAGAMFSGGLPERKPREEPHIPTLTRNDEERLRKAEDKRERRRQKRLRIH